MSHEEYPKGPWIFPIYKHGKKKYIPILWSLILAYIIPTVLVIVLSPITRTNALLFQLEIVFVAICFTLTGVLTRSKLRGFLNIIPATLSYLTIEGVSGFFDPPIANPYAIFNYLRDPLNQLLVNLEMADTVLLGGLTVSDLLAYLVILDLLFIWIIALIGGLFASTIATGFWNYKGEFKIISVIAKIIAIPMALIFLVVLPILLHGVASVAAGGAYLGAGGSELALAFGVDLGGAVGAQEMDFDINNINITKLQTHSKEAAKYFSRADTAFQQMKGNLIVGAVLSNLPSGYEAFENITATLDLVGAITEITYVIPELFMGFQAIQTGFEYTFGIIEAQAQGTGLGGATSTEFRGKTAEVQQQVTYNPEFNNTGLANLYYAFANFSKAWDSTEGDSEGHGLKSAIERASSLSQVEALTSMVNIGEFLNALDVTVQALLNLEDSIIPFINGTYKTILGLKALGLNAFDTAGSWIDKAVVDFVQSNTTLATIARPEPVNITLYGNADDPNDDTTIIIPIDGIVDAAADLNNLLVDFGYGASSGISFFNDMNGIMIDIDDLDFTDVTGISDPTFWDDMSNSLTDARDSFDSAKFYISSAGTKATTFTEENSYGEFLDPLFIEGDGAIFPQVAKFVSDYQGNLTDFTAFMDAITNTTFSFRDFSLGAGDFNDAFETFNDTSNDAELQAVKAKFVSSRDYALAAYHALAPPFGSSQEAPTNVNAETLANWKDALYDPDLEPYTINTDAEDLYGIDTKAIEMIELIVAQDPSAPEFQEILQLMEDLNLLDIFS